VVGCLELNVDEVKMTDCKDRVVVVTGAARGIGRAHALAFAEAGARVVVNDLGVASDGKTPDEGPAREVVAAIESAGGEAIANFQDVADWQGAESLIRAGIDRWGRLDVLVNNAGFVRDRMFVSTSEEEWDAVVRVHLRGHFCPARHAAAYWRSEAKAGRTTSARIINTSSGAGLQGSVGQSSYSAAKAAIASMTLVQATELARYGVTANAIAPIARTRMTEALFADMMAKPNEGFDEMAPENVSPLVVWLGSLESSEVTGRVFEVAGGKISISDGWRPAATVDIGRRWTVDELGESIAGLVDEAVDPLEVYGA
jgi:NAD(P)-dependent dehydrogenase (short-subunit alcohol dehydrogenase family)